jgi:hypothetical protein
MSSKHTPSPALCVALLALFISLGGVGVAASGTDFILGRNNTAKAKTSLTAPVAGNSLQITNTLPGGSALGLSVDSGSPPFTTNSSTKVPNLNSDLLDGQNSTAFLGANGTAANANKLDGLDSTQFVQGGGSFSGISATSTVPAGGSRLTNLGAINGLTFFGTCADTSSSNTGAQITLRNGTNNAITFLRDEGGDLTSEVLQPNDQDGDMPVQALNHFIWHGGLGSQGFTIDTWTYFNNLTCTFDVQLIASP